MGRSLLMINLSSSHQQHFRSLPAQGLHPLEALLARGEVLPGRPVFPRVDGVLQGLLPLRFLFFVPGFGRSRFHCSDG